MKRLVTLLASLAAICLTSCEWLDPEHSGGGDTKIPDDVRFWSVVGQLVSMNDITLDYQGKNFDPIIGTEDQSEPGTRIVAVNDLETAVERYNSLTGAGITEETATHTFSDKAVGTLTWTKKTDNSAWAVVDVSIKAVPKLQRIVYRSAEQGDSNYSTVTTDGLTLTLVQERDWNAQGMDLDTLYPIVAGISSFPLINSATMYLNGQKYDFQKWNEMENQ